MPRLGFRRSLPSLSLMPLLVLFVAVGAAGKGDGGLRFQREGGTFKVLQVADMHYADGRSTGCEDVLPEQVAGCSDLNTTAFLYRVLRAEDPDLVVFTGMPRQSTHSSSSETSTKDTGTGELGGWEGFSGTSPRSLKMGKVATTCAPSSRLYSRR